MGTQLPSLSRDGAVTFASPEEFEASWTQYVEKGALPVRPDRVLAPLETLDVHLVAPGLSTRIELSVEVVQLGPGRALLRLMKPAPAKPALEAEPARPTVEPAVEPAAPPVAPPAAPTPEPAPVDAHAPPMASPIAPAEPAPPVAPTEPGPAEPAPTEPAPVLEAAPVLERVATAAVAEAPVEELVPPDPSAMPPPWMSAERVSSQATRTQDLDIRGLDAVPEPDPPPTRTRLGPGMTIELEPMPNSAEFTELAPISSEGLPTHAFELAAPAPNPFGPRPVSALNATPSPPSALEAPLPAPALQPPAPAPAPAATPAPALEAPAPATPPPAPAAPAPAAPAPAAPAPAAPAPAAPAPAATPAPAPEAPAPAPAAPAPAAPAPAATPAPAPEAPAPAPAAPAPAAPAPAPEAAAPAPTPAPAPAPAPTPAAAAPVSPVSTVMPPWFTGDALRFQSNEDLRAARADLLGVGAVLAIVDGKVPHTIVELKLAVGSKETRGRAKISLSAASPGTAVAQCTEKNGFKPLIEELEGMTGVFTRPTLDPTPPPSATDTGAVPTALDAPSPIDRTPGPGIPGPRAFNLPRQGACVNPTTAAGILAMPLARTPTDAELAHPSVPLLLRWLRTTRGTLRLEATAADHPVFSAVFVDGREVRTAASIATLGKSLALPEMTYTITDLGRPPQMTTSSRTLHLIGEVVRALTLAVPIEDLARAFPAKPGMCARGIPDVVSGFGLPPQHSRFVKSDVDGTQYIDEIARAAVGGRTVWETLYLLEVYNGLAWDQPPPNKRPSTGTARSGTTGLFERPSDAEVSWAPFDGKDHFQVLGLHWSSSPAEVGPAYQKLRADFSVGGMKRPATQAAAERILKRLEEAHKVLSDNNARRAYRREKYNLVWSHQAQLLVQKAKLSLYRKDFIETQNILLAAEDMSPSEEAAAMLKALKQKTT